MVSLDVVGERKLLNEVESTQNTVENNSEDNSNDLPVKTSPNEGKIFNSAPVGYTDPQDSTEPSYQQFVNMFPAFSNTSIYSSEIVEYFMGVAKGYVSKSRWGKEYKFGVYLVTAHLLTLMQMQNPSNGGTGGVGLPTREGVGDVSIEYNVTVAKLDGGGTWNLTVYGQLYLERVRVYGSGGKQFGDHPTWVGWVDMFDISGNVVNSGWLPYM